MYIHVVGIVDTLTAVEVVSHLPCRSGKYVFATHLRRSPSMCVVIWEDVHGCYLRGVTTYVMTHGLQWLRVYTLVMGEA